jgi:hypothetical protein
VLLRQSLHPVASSCSGVRPLRDACVATGMNIGSWTGPCGSVSIEARALVVCKFGLVEGFLDRYRKAYRTLGYKIKGKSGWHSFRSHGGVGFGYVGERLGGDEWRRVVGLLDRFRRFSANWWRLGAMEFRLACNHPWYIESKPPRRAAQRLFKGYEST